MSGGQRMRWFVASFLVGILGAGVPAMSSFSDDTRYSFDVQDHFSNATLGFSGVARFSKPLVVTPVFFLVLGLAAQFLVYGQHANRPVPPRPVPSGKSHSNTELLIPKTEWGRLSAPADIKEAIELIARYRKWRTERPSDVEKISKDPAIKEFITHFVISMVNDDVISVSYQMDRSERVLLSRPEPNEDGAMNVNYDDGYGLYRWLSPSNALASNALIISVPKGYFLLMAQPEKKGFSIQHVLEPTAFYQRSHQWALLRSG